MTARIHADGVRAAAMAITLTVATACGQQDTPAPAPRDPDRLAALPLAADSVTVSGISAGGAMAVQFHVAQSSLVHGAGVLAAGPYFCASNSLGDALGRCMTGNAEIPVAELVGLTSQLALEDEIDPIAGLVDDRVWIFHGAADPVVARPVVDALEQYYTTLVDPDNVVRVEMAGAGHTFPAASAGLAACGTTAAPFVANCGRDGARELLEHLYGPFTAPAGAPPAAGELRTFRQGPYARALQALGLADEGWLYVPSGCGDANAAGRCRLHVVFHGCKQGSSYVQDQFVRQSGYLAAADAGRIVMLFPQAAPTFQPLNPNGCWDWWGYGGEAYATRRGPQVMAVRAMVDDLLGVAEATPHAGQ